MSKKKIQAITTQLAVHDIFGQFRYFKNDDGEIWWVAKDVAKVLNLTNVRKNLVKLDDDEKKIINLKNTVTNGYTIQRGNPNVTIVNESGLYHLIFMSRKPEAKNFRKWVTSEVLPSIRKNGYYRVEQSDNPKENLLEDWKPTGTFEDVATVTNILDQKGIEYDYVITSVTFEYNEQLGRICPCYNIDLKIKD